MEFLQENWIALLSFLVALVGGVPGTIAVVDHLRKRPIFRFTLVNFITGQDATKDRTMVLLSGTAGNEGSRPLVPAVFGLEAKSRGAWIQFERMLIPADVRFASDVHNISVADASRDDLQKLSRAISTDTPANGHLMFISSDITLDAVRQSEHLELRLTCLDVFGKRHRTRLDIPKDTGRALVFPKHGVTVTHRPQSGQALTGPPARQPDG